ncbi:ATP-binding protein [soil metagenome]
MKPLDRFRSIKVKLSIVIVCAVGISVLISFSGWRVGLPIWLRPPVALGLALLFAYPFSRGITSPLREMSTAATAMAEGDFSQPVSTTSRDEVGDLARAFEQMRSELAEVDRQRRALIANVSHELRTPLTALRARMENIVDGVEVNDAAHAAASLAEIERLSELVERVLDLSRLESGASPLHVETFSVEMLLVDATSNATVDGDGRRIQIGADDQLTYCCDRARIHQVVSNLVDNALRFSPPDSPITVRADATVDGIELAVADRGPGIAEAERDRVFERFYRTDDARSSAMGGSGLGLAIVTEIVDLHGGSIRIGSNRPVGCSVLVRLPHMEGSPS